jgi:hypothetical protein
VASAAIGRADEGIGAVETFNDAIDTLAGLTLPAMASVYPYAQNLAERRRCEGMIRQVRRELADKAMRRAEPARK